MSETKVLSRAVCRLSDDNESIVHHYWYTSNKVSVHYPDPHFLKSIDFHDLKDKIQEQLQQAAAENFAEKTKQRQQKFVLKYLKTWSDHDLEKLPENMRIIIDELKKQNKFINVKPSNVHILATEYFYACGDVPLRANWRNDGYVSMVLQGDMHPDYDEYQELFCGEQRFAELHKKMKLPLINKLQELCDSICKKGYEHAKKYVIEHMRGRIDYDFTKYTSDFVPVYTIGGGSLPKQFCIIIDELRKEGKF